MPYRGDGIRWDTWVPPYKLDFVQGGGEVEPRPYGSVSKGAVNGASGTPFPTGALLRVRWGRADVGSELSIASGRRSEVSEWPRSKLGASAVRQRRNFGHRNRTIGPYKKYSFCRGQ